MDQVIEVEQVEPGEYTAQVSEGAQSTRYTVYLPDEVLDELDLPADVEGEAIVERAMAWLLEEAPVTGLPAEVDLSVIADDQPQIITTLQQEFAGR